jgi:hypothetical protein
VDAALDAAACATAADETAWEFTEAPAGGVIGLPPSAA